MKIKKGNQVKVITGKDKTTILIKGFYKITTIV